MNFKQYKVISFDHFINILNANKNDDRIRLFRGQKEDLPLYSKLYRNSIKFKKTNEIYKIEKKILTRLKAQLIKSESNNLSDWDLMILAQHYGLPTRLIDWSANPLVALWFAYEKFVHDDKDRVVWGLIAEHDSYVDFENESPFNIRFVKVLKPPLIDIRILVQNSWFSVQDIQFFGKGGDGLPRINKNDPLESNENFDSYLAKFILPNALRPEILNRLKVLGIERSTIYPNLSKICSKILPSEFKYK